MHLNQTKIKWEEIPTEIGPRWDQWREEHHLKNNPFWERYERQPLEKRRLWWWMIARWGMRALQMNLALVALFLIVVWAEPRVLKANLSLLYIPWQLAACFIPVPFAWLWYRAIKDCGEERRNPETWDVLMTTPIPIRQLFWARMTPIFREALLYALYLPGMYLFPVLVRAMAFVYNDPSPRIAFDMLLVMLILCGTLYLILFRLALASLAFAGAVGMASASMTSAILRTVGMQLAMLGIVLALSMVVDWVIWGPHDLDRAFIGVTGTILLMLTVYALAGLGYWYVRWLDRRRDPYWRPVRRVKLKDIR